MSRVFFYILSVFCFLAPLVFKGGIYDYANSVKLAFLQLGAAVLVLVWAYGKFRAGRLTLRQSSLHRPLLCLIALLTLSMLPAVNHLEAFKVWQHWVLAILLFLVVADSLQSSQAADTVLAALFASGVVVAMVGICQYLFGLTFVPQTVSPAATFGNKNMAAQYVMLTLPLGFFFLIAVKKRLFIWGAGAGMAMIGVFLVYTGTRGAWLSCAAELVVFVLLAWRQTWRHVDWSRHRYGAVLVFSLLFLVLINMGPQGFQWQMNSLWNRVSTVAGELADRNVERENKTTSVGVRLAIWRNTVEMIKDHPLLGVGLANHKIVYPLYHRRVLRDRQFTEKAQLTHVHNDYLQFVAETGLAGLLFLGWLGGAVLLMIFRATAAGVEAGGRWRGGAMGMALAGLAVNALFSFPMQIAVPPFFLIILLAILCSQERKDERRVIGGGSAPVVLLAFSGLLLVWISVYQLQQLKLLRHYYVMINLERRHAWDEILNEYQQAAVCFPPEMKLLFFKAEAHLFKGMNRQAADEYEEYLQYYPNSINALRNLGISYSRQGYTARALTAYGRYLQIIPDSPAVNAYRDRLLRKTQLRRPANGAWNGS